MAIRNLFNKIIPQSLIATAAIATCAFTASSAKGATIVLDFEGVGDLNPVGNFYDTAPQDFDIVFSDNALGIVDEDAGGSGNFGGEPSPDTILFFTDGQAATMNALNGFTNGFSFFYSSPFPGAFINVYDGLNATGNILATLALPTTPLDGDPDPTGNFSPFVPLGVNFLGTARSVDFGGSANLVGFDNITLGSATPGGGTQVPEPGSALALLAVGALGAGSTIKRKLLQKASVKA